MKKIFEKLEFWNQLKNRNFENFGKFNLKKLANLKVWKKYIEKFKFWNTSKILIENKLKILKKNLRIEILIKVCKIKI